MSIASELNKRISRINESKQVISEELKMFNDFKTWESKAKSLGYTVKEIFGSAVTKDRGWNAFNKNKREVGLFVEEDKEGSLSI